MVLTVSSHIMRYRLATFPHVTHQLTHNDTAIQTLIVDMKFINYYIHSA